MNESNRISINVIKYRDGNLKSNIFGLGPFKIPDHSHIVKANELNKTFNALSIPRMSLTCDGMPIFVGRRVPVDP